jgi:TDG/mug DNA glycosylase family protein
MGGAPGASPRPSPADLEAARERTLPDLLAPDLAVVFCGINPGLWSAATGHHFARPGNRFWPALHASGFTGSLLRPDEQGRLPGLGLGLTNICPRATARADELSRRELREGAAALGDKVTRLRPRWLAVVGVTAYRVAFGSPSARVGRQSTSLGETEVWVLPNPSGLNAHWPPPRLAEAFADLRAAADAAGPAAGSAVSRS